MSLAKPLIEQRETARYSAQTGVLAEPNARVTRVCHVVDVSQGGLCFTYVARERWSESSCRLNILFPLKGFVLNHIPFETIYDFPADDPFSALPLRRRGGRLGRLTPQQEAHLRYFIERCTTGEATSPLYTISNTPLIIAPNQGDSPGS